MIQLKNVSKFYYSKGIIASGFTKVNLEFEIGEFVAITGESGSGKSTLLNVISGLDSYEEGEMYVFGEETSHYIEKDWEEYRRKNIGNIYQNFNIINSYTVYQNIELALSLNGVSRKKRKEKVMDLIRKVDLLKYKNTKVSKLSGGQKQRVAIARALAKEVPIIIADEPTGNLDKKSSESIIRLLKEVAKDRLVIIVTHNYEQVEDYVTRKITMHDGKVIEDKKISSPQKENVSFSTSYKDIRFFDKLRLGVRNTFNVIPKFVLLFLVYSFVVCALMGEYSFFRKGEYETSKQGYNYFFQDTSDKRVVLNKKDRTSFSKEELDTLRNLENIDILVENDTTIDQMISMTDNKQEYWLNGRATNLDLLPEKIDYGRAPFEQNEIVLQGSKDDYYLYYDRDNLIGKSVYLVNEYGMVDDHEFKVVGIVYYEDNLYSPYDYRIYFPDWVFDDLMYDTHVRYSTVTVDFMGTNHISHFYDKNFRVDTNTRVLPGKAIVSEDFNIYCDKGKCIGKTFSVSVKNIYFEDHKDFMIDNTYNKNTITKVLDLPKYTKEDYDFSYNGVIYVNPDDYHSLFSKGTYQISIYVKDVLEIDTTIQQLESMGYKTLKISDTLKKDGALEVIKIFKMLVTLFLVVVLFFISYFIIRIILKSRNIYYSILRMLGASKKVCRELLMMELFVVCNISYFCFLTLAELNRFGKIHISFIDTVNTYFRVSDYLVLYAILMVMSLLISFRYSRKLFKNSVMSVYREEV